MKNIEKNTWKNDIPSGIVVYLVALPLCLGIASASTGRPDLLFSGIIAGIIGGIIVGWFSGSSLGVSGPAAGLITIVLGGIEKLGSFETFLLAIVISGIIQVIAGYAKAGIIGHYFPNSVIRGMLAGIGITLILKQLPHALGFDKDAIGDEAFLQGDGRNTITEIFYAIKYHSIGAIIISFVSLFILIIFEKPFFKSIKYIGIIPASLFVVLIGILFNFIFKENFPNWTLGNDHLVQLPVFTGLDSLNGFLKFPNFQAITTNTYTVIEVSLTLALIASLETLLSVEATDKMDPYKRITPTNRELKAQGIGNIISGLLGGLPITQVIVRSSANVNSGGQSKKSTIIHGFILLVSVLSIPTLLNTIPIAALAAILLTVGYKLTSFGLFKMMYKQGMEQFIPFIATIAGVVFLDLLKGIAIGMIIAIFYILKKNFSNSYNKRIENIDNKKTYHLTLSEEVSFLNKGSIVQTLNSIESESKVVIDGTKSVSIDQDVCEAIYEYKNFNAIYKNIEVVLLDIPEFEKKI